MSAFERPTREEPRPDGSRTKIVQVLALLSLAIGLVGLSALVASGLAAVGTRVHYVAGIAPLVSLILASVTLIWGRALNLRSRLTAAKVAVGLDLTFYILAVAAVLAMVQNVDG